MGANTFPFIQIRCCTFGVKLNNVFTIGFIHRTRVYILNSASHTFFVTSYFKRPLIKRFKFSVQQPVLLTEALSPISKSSGSIMLSFLASVALILFSCAMLNFSFFKVRNFVFSFRYSTRLDKKLSTSFGTLLHYIVHSDFVRNTS